MYRGAIGGAAPAKPAARLTALIGDLPPDQTLPLCRNAQASLQQGPKLQPAVHRGLILR